MRLVKVAKELNVGTNTIVDYLNDSGYEVANKPTSKISDEMYDALLKEFQASANVKEAADKLIIGNRTKEEEEVPVKKEVTFTKPTPPPPPPTPEPVVEEPVAKVETPEPVVEQELKEPTPKKGEETISHRNEVGPKVIGKIDLTPKPKKPKAKPVQEKPKVKEEKPVATPTPKKEEEKVVAKTPVEKKKVDEPTKAVPPEMLRAETPELKGLKVVGKINMDKITPKKKADNKSDKPSPNAPKRKRKRKKVSTGTNRPSTQRGGGNNNRGGNRKPPAKEKEGVSQKEVDDKIKATMAKLSGGGKKKRQKIRRGNRD